MSRVRGVHKLKWGGTKLDLGGFRTKPDNVPEREQWGSWEGGGRPRYKWRKDTPSASTYQGGDPGVAKTTSSNTRKKRKIRPNKHGGKMKRLGCGVGKIDAKSGTTKGNHLGVWKSAASWWKDTDDLKSRTRKKLRNPIEKKKNKKKAQKLLTGEGSKI